MPSPSSILSLVSDEMELFTVLFRIRVLLAGTFREEPEQLAPLLFEILVRCQSGVEDPNEVLEIVRPIALAAPTTARNALIEALERGVDTHLLPGLLDILLDLGLDLQACENDCLHRLYHGTTAEKVQAMHLLCALGPCSQEATRLVLTLDLGRLWRLEWLRLDALVLNPIQTLPLAIEALEHPQESVRARAEAVLEKLGPLARPAVPTLLRMPAWQGRDEATASPALFAIGAAAIEEIREALTHPNATVRQRAQAVLHLLQPTAAELTAEKAACPVTR